MSQHDLSSQPSHSNPSQADSHQKKRWDFPIKRRDGNYPKKQIRQPLTNRAELPQAFIEALTHDSYSMGDADMSITGLLKPPRVVVLERDYETQIVEDVSDRIWSLMGQSIHTILERANRTAVSECRLSMEIEDWTISGGMDVYDEEGILSDYKVTSVWKVIKGDLDEWTKQLNGYSVLLRHHGHKVEKLQVIAILRDWSKMEAERDPTYPQSQVVNIHIPLWEPDRALAFLKERVILHQQAIFNLPECNPVDRWARPEVFAVMKKGRKSAVKLYSNEDEAKLHVGFDRTLSVVRRPRVNVRCKSYCSVSKFCTQYQNEITASLVGTIENESVEEN